MIITLTFWMSSTSSSLVPEMNPCTPSKKIIIIPHNAGTNYFNPVAQKGDYLHQLSTRYIFLHLQCDCNANSTVTLKRQTLCQFQQNSNEQNRNRCGILNKNFEGIHWVSSSKTKTNRTRMNLMSFTQLYQVIPHQYD